MKHFISILMLITLALGVVSCGGDDDAPQPPKDMPKKIDATKKVDYKLTFLGNSVITLKKNLNLSDFPEVKKEWEQYVNKAKVRTTSKIEIKGISEKDKLKGFKIKVKGTDISKKFTGKDNYTQNGVFNFDEDRNFIKQIMNQLVAKKSIILEFAAENEKETDKNINVILTFDVQFEL